MPKRGENQPPKLSTTNNAELARFAGVSRDTIKEWRKRPDFPLLPDGTVELWQMAVWRAGVDGQLKPATNGDVDRLEQAEIRKAEADATLKETKVKQLIGQLISKVVVIAALSKLFNEIRARLQAIPGELASSIPPELRTDLTLDLETKINLILTGMAAWSKSWNVTMESQTRGQKRSTSRQSGRVAKRSRQGSSRSGSRGAKKTS